MNVKELEMLYEAALRPIFGDQLHIIHDSDHFVTIILNGNGKIFFLRFMEQIMSAYTGVTNVLFFRPCLKIGGMADWGRFFTQRACPFFQILFRGTWKTQAARRCLF